MRGKQLDEDDAGRMLGTASEMRGPFGPDDGDDPLLVEAADWLVRLMSGTATNDDAEQLAVWRAQSAAHDAAFREVAGVRSYAVVARNTKKRMSRRAVLSAGGGGALAVVAGLGLARPPLGLWPSYAELTADHRTPVGGRLAIRPILGVEVELSSRTAVSVIEGGHGVRLIAGETYVQAARQSLDFTVEAGRLRITTRDAEFNVQALSSGERVACVRGELRCQAGDRSINLAANQALSLSSDGSARLSSVNAAKESAWRKGLLVFEGTPLADVVDQINLHRSGRVVLTDSSLGSVPLNAVFHIAQIENSVPQIEQLLNIRARHVAGGVVLLG